MKVGVNSFCIKTKLTQDFDGTLQRLKDGGLAFLEPCITFSEQEIASEPYAEQMKLTSGGIWPVQAAADRIAQVRAAGLEVIDAHVFVPAEELLATLPRMVELAKQNGLRYYVIGLSKTLEQIRPMLPILEQAAVALAAQGITLCYHNNQCEGIPENGTSVMELLMAECPHLRMQIDVGWAQYGGTDPVAFIQNYSERITMLHLKDMHAPTGDLLAELKAEQFTVVGEGFLNLPAIMGASKACPLDEYGVVIDQDDSLGDIVEDIIRGAEYTKEAEQK